MQIFLLECFLSSLITELRLINQAVKTKSQTRSIICFFLTHVVFGTWKPETFPLTTPWGTVDEEMSAGDSPHLYSVSRHAKRSSEADEQNGHRLLVLGEQAMFLGIACPGPTGKVEDGKQVQTIPLFVYLSTCLYTHI